jgi:protein ImuB
MFRIGQKLHPLLDAMEKHNQALCELQIDLFLDNNNQHKETIKPAYPELNAHRLLRLIHLRLDSLTLAAGVKEYALHAFGVKRVEEQLELFRRRQRQKLAVANEALARIRAEFGETAVLRATLHPAHLPEARFRWEPIEATSLPKPQSEPSKTFVRRILHRPVGLFRLPYHESDGCILLGLEYGPVIQMDGPYVLSGGWWARHVQREYYYAHTERGDILWVYYDRPRRHWFLQGRIE